METININQKIQVLGGELLEQSPQILVDVVDFADTIKIPAAEADVEIDLGVIALDDLFLFAVLADTYPLNVDGSAKVSFKVHEAISAPIPLYNMMVLAGKGAAGLLRDVPDKLFFSNTHTGDVYVSILAGRHATP